MLLVRYSEHFCISRCDMKPFNTDLPSSGDRGGSEEPTQAYSEVRRGERRSDNEGIHLKANRYKVLVTDNVASEGLDILTQDGTIEVDVRPGIKNPELAQIIGEYDAIITRSGTAVTADLLEKPGRLKIIGRAGVGLDNIDIEAASKKGIIVMNA